MLAQYLTYVRPDFEAGLIGVSEVFDDLIARDAVLTTAAYGSTTGYRLIRR